MTADGYDLWNQADDVHGVIEALGMRSAHVVGLSMGGMIAMRLALRHPDDVRSLVLMNTTADTETSEHRHRNEALIHLLEAGRIDEVLAALPPTFLADDFISQHRSVVDAWLDRLQAADGAGLGRVLRAVDAREDIRPRLGAIAVPALVIHGEQDIVFGPEHARDLAEAIPGARLATVSGGHQSNVDRPEATSRLIRDFLHATTAADARH